jgi:hypothetical protein
MPATLAIAGLMLCFGGEFLIAVGDQRPSSMRGDDELIDRPSPEEAARRLRLARVGTGGMIAFVAGLLMEIAAALWWVVG